MNLNRRDFLRQLGFGATGLAIASTLPDTSWALPTKTGKLPRSLPEAQGVAPGGLLDFVNTIESQKLNIHSMMVLRHGQVVAEGWWAPYAPQYIHTLYSLSKSFTSSAIGMAVDEKRLTVEDKVVSFFPKDVPATISANLASMRVKDLLTMSTGHDKDTTPALRGGTDTNWVKSFLAQPVDHEPGIFYMYNSGATYMLSAIIQKLTGQTLLDYLKPRLFGPLGIEGMDWEVDPNGINTGGWGLRIKTEDIAKFGQLYLQKGVWNGKRLISEAWVHDATRKEVDSKGGKGDATVNDWIQGYGYQFWRCRNDAYRADGAFGQFCIVLPKEDALIAITAESANTQGILDAVWNHVLPALRGTGLLPADKIKQAALTQKLATLTLTPSVSQTALSVQSKISGKTYAVADNSLHVKDVTLTFGKDGCIFKLQDNEGDHQVLCGVGRWRESTTTFSVAPLSLTPTVVPNGPNRKVAGSGGWQDETTFVMTWRFIETAHYETVTCRFGSDGVQVEFQNSISILSKGKDKRPILEGKAVA